MLLWNSFVILVLPSSVSYVSLWCVYILYLRERPAFNFWKLYLGKRKNEGPRRLNKLGGLGVILALFYLYFTLCMCSSLLRPDFLSLWWVGATLQLWCVVFSLRWLLWLQSVASGAAVEALRLSFPAAWKIFLGQGSNSCPLHCHSHS